MLVKQVKKGPNGKDYEYEYVYYYYDEEDENKAGTAGSAVTNSYDVPSRTTPAPRRGGSSSGRSKYSSAERSSTVEPASNEVIPNRNGNGSGNRARQLTEAEDVSEERLPTNTRFPPRCVDQPRKPPARLYSSNSLSFLHKQIAVESQYSDHRVVPSAREPTQAQLGSSRLEQLPDPPGGPRVPSSSA